MIKKISEDLERHRNPAPQVVAAATKDLMVYTAKFYLESLKTFDSDPKLFKEWNNTTCNTINQILI